VFGGVGDLIYFNHIWVMRDIDRDGGLFDAAKYITITNK